MNPTLFTRLVETLVGLALIAAGIALLFREGDAHSDWLILGLVATGGHFVSKSLMRELVGHAKELLPWLRGERGRQDGGGP